MGEPFHSIVGDPQYVEVTATTDASGYLSYTFPNAIDVAMVSVNEPQAGSGAGIVGASVTVTGPKSVKVRCWENSNSGLRTCQSKQVTVTILGLSAA